MYYLCLPAKSISIRKTYKLGVCLQSQQNAHMYRLTTVHSNHKGSDEDKVMSLYVYLAGDATFPWVEIIIHMSCMTSIKGSLFYITSVHQRLLQTCNVETVARATASTCIVRAFPEEVRQGQKVNVVSFSLSRCQEWFSAVLLAIFELSDIDLVLYPSTLAH